MGDNILQFAVPLVEPVEKPKKARRNAVEMRFVTTFVRLVADVYPPLVAAGAQELEDIGLYLLQAARDPTLTSAQHGLAVAIARQLIAEAMEQRLDTMEQRLDTMEQSVGDEPPEPPEAAA